jgi:hypothetical protein
MLFPVGGSSLLFYQLLGQNYRLAIPNLKSKSVGGLPSPNGPNGQTLDVSTFVFSISYCMPISCDVRLYDLLI